MATGESDATPKVLFSFLRGAKQSGLKKNELYALRDRNFYNIQADSSRYFSTGYSSVNVDKNYCRQGYFMLIFLSLDCFFESLSYSSSSASSRAERRESSTFLRAFFGVDLASSISIS